MKVPLRIVAMWLGRPTSCFFIGFRVEEILQQADYLYESGETERLYQLLTQHKDR